MIGDACDKGVPAAIFMALTRSLLRAEASRARSPREALQNVNRHLLDMNDAGMFVTAIYGVLHQPTRTFNYARAGHTLPLLRGVGGAVLAPPHGTGQPLGLWPEPSFDEQRIVIPRGGALLLYTDGVTEAVDAQGALFGTRWLRTAVSVYRNGSGAGALRQRAPGHRRLPRPRAAGRRRDAGGGACAVRARTKNQEPRTGCPLGEPGALWANQELPPV